MVFSLQFSGLVILSIIVIIILANNLNYKNHCIEDLEANIKRIQRTKNEEFVGVLNELKDMQNYETPTRELYTRRMINEAIEKYSKENRCK